MESYERAMFEKKGYFVNNRDFRRRAKLDVDRDLLVRASY